jgi:aspartate-semialdehyde dehydrogenase
MAGCNIAVIGATGAVGTVFLNILEDRAFPTGDIRLCASERSWGKKLIAMGKELSVEEATPMLLSEVDLVFVCAGSDISLEIGPLAVEQGATVVDKSSAFRMDPNVPLVVPEVNGDDLEQHNGIVSVPNCSTAPLVMVLKPLNAVNPVERVIVDTYQSVSGTGAAAMDELRVQSGQVLESSRITPKEYPHQIAFNVLPHIESFHDNGYTNEEMKMVWETRKILHEPNLQISATCVRVPVMVGHSEAVHIDFEESISPGEVRQILSDTPGVTVVDDPATNKYPMPIDAEGQDDVFVGRIRQDVSNPKGIAMWLATDNLRKGAALNGIQIAEELLRRELLLRTARRN